MVKIHIHYVYIDRAWQHSAVVLTWTILYVVTVSDYCDKINFWMISPGSIQFCLEALVGLFPTN